MVIPKFLKHCSLHDLPDYLRKENAEELADTVENVLQKEIDEAQEHCEFQLQELEGDIQELQRRNDALEEGIWLDKNH